MRRALLTITVVLFLAMPGPAYAVDWPTPQGPNGTGFVEIPRAKGHWLRWTTRISDLPSGIYPMSPLLAHRGKVFVNGAGTDSVLALDAKTGEVVWRFMPDPRASGSFGGYPNPNEPFISGNVYYTTANNGFLYALDVNTGRKIWSFQVTGTEYNKAVAQVSVCGGRVFMDVLGGIPDKGHHNVYALDARTGRKLWSTYAGAPEYPGEGVWPDFPSTPDQAQKLLQARSTRRFEARPGPTCSGNRVFYNAEDGVLRVLDAATGTQVGAYDWAHAGDIGGAVDGASGITDPRSGHLLRNSLNNRMVRLDPLAMENACKGQRSGLSAGLCTDPNNESQKVHPSWRNIYGDCSGGPSGATCGILSLPDRSGVIATYTGPRNDGIIGGAVFSGGIAVADWDTGRRVVYSANHDGHLYAIDFENPKADRGPIWKAPLGKIPKALRDGTYSRRAGGKDLYTAAEGSYCAVPARCLNGPWEHRASNVSGPAVGGGVVYVPGSMDHAMYGIDMKTGAQVFRYEVQWDDQAQYPPFGDRKPNRFVDLDELIQTTAALDGTNVYFAAHNGVVYAFSTQEVISSPRRNLAVLGSGIVPFIPKWKEGLGAFDYVWTPQGDWYNPGYTSPDSTTAKQAAPGVPGGRTPFGYKGALAERRGSLMVAVILIFLLATVATTGWRLTSHPLSLDRPLLIGRRELLVEALEKLEKMKR